VPDQRTDFAWTHRQIPRWNDDQASRMIRTGHHCGSCVGCVPSKFTPKDWDGKPDRETICSAYLRKER